MSLPVKAGRKGVIQMEPYTIEDIELLRKKSGISYQEAVTLLDYHNGSLARALIDLEKHGKLKTEEQQEKEEAQMSENTKKGETKQKALGFLQKLYRSRVKIRKGDTSILNVSVLFAGICLILAPHITIAGIIVSMILGYQFSFTGMDPDFASENLEKMVRSAAQNAKSSVSSVVRNIKTENRDNGQRRPAPDPEHRTAPEKPAGTTGTVMPEAKTGETSDSDPAESLRRQAHELEETMDSFFDSSPAAAARNSAYSAATSSVPTIQVPVQAETRDGEITVDDDQDGYSSVTIG